MQIIKHYYRRVKRTLEFIPIIWKGYDWDSYYAFELLKYQLNRTADHLESEKACTFSAKDNAKKIRTATRLLEKVINAEYSMEYLKAMEDLYGDGCDLVFIPTGDSYGSCTLASKYETEKSPAEIKSYKDTQIELMNNAQKKQEKAERILWEYIKHNRQNWWD